ncbi:transcriptional regulator [Malaciobacter marinus]|uniref:helix-turn-helix transcriptional regulator n=1 Tax=Malaciobacter marinus TaxID=505249 RepID=UPI000C082851|nr:WYL domain-containing protein [Malaciobacter marinus]PHO11350.1 transcriptional regulator [Malaciobacter marinus]
MSKSHDTLAQRLSLILIKLNNGERFTVVELANEFNVSARTIQRDIKERLLYIPIEKDGDYYSMASYALGKLNFEDIKNFATLIGTKNLYPPLSNEFISDILNAKLNSAYLIKNQGFEDISHKQKCFETMSATIIKRSPISFEYKDKQRTVNPYKLINNQGIWYLLADENGSLKNFTFSKIKKFKWEDDTKTFTPKKEFLEQVEQNNLNWFTSDELIEVTLQINNVVKEYFIRKDILPNQKIIEENDTHFIISTKVSYDDEIIKLVKWWIPYIKIMEPSYLSDKLNKILLDFLNPVK